MTDLRLDYDEDQHTYTVSDGTTYTAHDTITDALHELRRALIAAACPYCGQPTMHEDTNGWCRNTPQETDR
jgi:hypothetical protein